MSHPFDKGRAALNRTPLDDHRLLSGAYWAELRTFLAVAKSKSFNRAAKTLGVSPATVSRDVYRLQDVMGSQLLVSSTAGVILTDRGNALAGVLLQLDEQLFAVSRNLHAEKEEAEGLVRFSATEALAGIFAVPRLAEFSAKYPKIRLHIRAPINLTSFRENQSEIVLGFSPPDQAGIESLPLGYVHLIPFASEKYFAAHGVPTRSNLEGHKFIDAEYYSSPTDVWDPWRGALQQGVLSHMCDNSFAYCFMVKEGLGIGLLASYVLPDPALVPLDIGVHIRLPLFLQAMPERLHSRPVRVVYDWLSEVFSAKDPWLSSDLNLDENPRQLLSSTLSRILLADWKQ